METGRNVPVGVGGRKMTYSEPKHRNQEGIQQKQEKTGTTCDMITFLNIRV